MNNGIEIQTESENTFSPSSHFSYELFPDGETRILAPMSMASDFEFTRQETVKRLAEVLHITEEDVSTEHQGLSDQELFEELESTLVGYAFGITDRNITETNMVIPGVSEAIQKANSNILVIANGLSEIATLNYSVPVTIIDRFDYDQITRDFEQMKSSKPELYASFEPLADVAQKITTAENITSKKFIVGLGENKIPDGEMHRYKLIVSCHGPRPNENSLPEFLAMAADGGEIYVDRDPEMIQKALVKMNIPSENVVVTGIPDTNGSVIATKMTVVRH